MAGHGSPQCELVRFARQIARCWLRFITRGPSALLVCALLAFGCSFATVPVLRADDSLDIRLRVAWGAGSRSQWEGTVRVEGGVLSDLDDLGLNADSPGSKYIENGQIIIRQPSPSQYDGFDF